MENMKYKLKLCLQTPNPQMFSDLMLSALDSWSRGLGCTPGRVIVLCTWAKHVTLTVPLSTREFK